MIFDAVALAQPFDDTAGKRRGVLRRRDVLLEDDELVAAEAGDEILRAQHLAQAIGDRTQKLIAAGMTQRIVDLLELVKIDEEQSRQTLRMARDCEQTLDLVPKIDTVRQRREIVVAGQMADPGLGVAALRDVLEQQNRTAISHRLDSP